MLRQKALLLLWLVSSFSTLLFSSHGLEPLILQAESEEPRHEHGQAVGAQEQKKEVADGKMGWIEGRKLVYHLDYDGPITHPPLKPYGKKERRSSGNSRESKHH